MIAILEAHRAGLLAWRHWSSNIVAGVIVGVVALPLAMAFAIASGVKPEQGLYTAIIAGLAVSLFGGSRVQIAGPTGAFIVILSGVVAQYGVQGLQIATFMAGIILLLLGITKLGGVIKFIPRPVIIGFTSGIGVIIWVGQWKDFFGLPVELSGHFHQKLWTLLQAFPQLHLTTTAMAIVSLLLVIYSARLPGMKRVPGPLVALVLATVLQSLFQFEGVATIGSAFGEIPRQLPQWQWLPITFDRVVELIAPAFAIAMLGAIESLLSAVVADGMTGTRHNSNQELIGQGVANMASPLFGGIAATGAIARTATNIRNGGTSPIAGITHCITLVLIILILAPYAANVPLAALAAILFVVAWNMSEAKHFLRLVKQAPRADVAILLVTFLLTVFADLVVAVNIGVVLAMMHFLQRMARSVAVQRQNGLTLTQELAGLLQEHGLERLPDDIMVYQIEGPLFYGAAETFERAMSDTGGAPGVLVLRLGRVPFVDSTGLRTLENLVDDLQAKGNTIIFTEANDRVLGKLHRMGLGKKLGAQNICPSFNDVMARLISERGA
ncbi:MAG TPA: SulP family inorganic anion transporter [Pusillimonas sp.]|uniref:SulP family inorganic anion transporter n=1 Tax=Pusillimonas sp. TaxID=3040095 RepID=UPI002C298A94|nr:SulP family inorganic anion transporter [Pusillimonas sp.]HUH86724.1 SulP family inorganic anion transporter [Pusillimonas sp.]